ncbi:MAG TPA: hypothetical protein VF392_01375, partial [Terracidiphilus sp.]
MRLPVRFSATFVLAALALLPLAPRAMAQGQSTAARTAGNGTYISVDPLANVHYDNRYDISLGAAYAHIKAGPPPLHEGANLGGLDLNASYWFSKRWAAEGTGRAYMGTSGAAPNAYNISGPFVSQYVFAAGPEWLGPHNKHGALLAHAMVGGAYGKFEQDLRGQSPEVAGFFNDQVGLAAVIGGHIDLNRSARWAFRITPDALY